MKKIVNSKIGIIFISIIPTTIFYYSILKNNIMLTDLKPSSYFVIGVGIYVIVMIILFTIQFFYNFFKRLDKKLEVQKKYTKQLSDSMLMVTLFAIEKHNEQFQIFFDVLNKYSKKEINFIRKAEMTESEKILFDRVVEMEDENINKLEKILNTKFSKNKGDENYDSENKTNP